MNTPSSTSRRAWLRNPLLWCGLFLAVVACATFVPQHGWDPKFGPVVPHDTFPADCTICHESGGWHTLRADFAFDHAKETGVPLTGAHKGAGCLMCHNDRGPVAQFAAQGCAGCHADPHQDRMGRNCKDCHDDQTWQAREAIARHDRTRFPLVGVHAAVACFRCHPGAQVGNFAGADSQCSSCHLEDRARTTDPDHQALGYSLDCRKCHLPVGWAPARFDHPASFPLTKGHAGRACKECHPTPNSFTGRSTACASCHTPEHAATTQPSHPAAGFSTDCSQCHDTSTFAVSTWPHPASFPLTLGHAGRQCTACHQNQVYAGTPTTCVSCHQTNYQNAQNPNHVAAGYPTDCALCHNTATFHNGATAHPASFPLTNSHQQACNACHTTPGVYTGLSTTCSSCHLTAYQGAQNPNHVTLGYPTDCQSCHGTVSWHSGATTHPATFPLTNAHQQPCTACHTTPGVYTGLSTTCVSCHLTNYQNSTNPPHAAFQFSQTCQTCHGTTAWTPANFTHHFPITTGKHRTLQCFDCHDNASNRTQFSCINCHEHNQQNAGSHHGGVNNYQWNTAACYACHPTGRA